MSGQLRLRYLVVQAEWGALAEGGGGDALDPASAGPSDLFQALRATHQELFGDAGWGAVAPALAVTYYSAAARLAVVRCPAAAEEAVRAALALTRAVRRRAVALHTLQCVGTVRGLREALARVTRGVAGALRGAQASAGVQLGNDFFEALEREAQECL